MRVGIISPNILNHTADSKLYSDPDEFWPFNSLGKQTCLLFDKIYLTDDLDLTCKIINAGYDDDPNSLTLRYLAEKGLLLLPQDLGYTSRSEFLESMINGAVAEIHRQLLKVGNPSNNCGPGEYTYVGQPDIGDFEAHDGNHPRSAKGWNDPHLKVIRQQYESLLLR